MDQLDKTYEIAGSPAKLVGLTLLGVIMTVLSAAMALGYMGVAYGSFRQFIGMVGAVFFGAMLAIIVRRLLTSGSAIVTISPQGIVDTRVASGLIPWNAIHDIGVWTMHGQKIIVLAVPPEVEQSIGLTRMARWSRDANRKLGADGLCITAAGLKTKYDDLLAAIAQRVENASSAGAASRASDAAG